MSSVSLNASFGGFAVPTYPKPLAIIVSSVSSWTALHLSDYSSSNVDCSGNNHPYDRQGNHYVNCKSVDLVCCG